LNWYEYARSNPLGFVDKNGLWCNETWWANGSQNFDPIWTDMPQQGSNRQPSGAPYTWVPGIVDLYVHYYNPSNWFIYEDRLVTPIHPIVAFFNGNRSFAAGSVIVLANNADYDTKRHELGHTRQFEDLGGYGDLIRWWHSVAVPSMTADGVSTFYYSNPWERMADFFAGIDQGNYLYGSMPISVLYHEWLRSGERLSSVKKLSAIRRVSDFKLNLENIHGKVSHWFDTMAKCGYLE